MTSIQYILLHIFEFSNNVTWALDLVCDITGEAFAKNAARLKTWPAGIHHVTKFVRDVKSIQEGVEAAGGRSREN